MRALASTSRRFRHARSGIAAVEFALIFPIMALFIFGGYEIVRGITASRQMSVLANVIAQEITASKSNTITYADLHFFYNTTIPVFPQILGDAVRYNNYWWQNISITVSSVKFTQVCTGVCAYVPSVVWTSGAQQRSCIVPALPASDQASPSPFTLPVDTFGPGSIIVVDLQYQYRPLLGSSFIKPFTITRSVYMQPRYVPTLYYEKMTSDDIASPCSANSH